MDTQIQKTPRLNFKNTCIKFLFAYEQRNVEKMLSLCNGEGTVEFLPLGESGIGTISGLGKNIWTLLIDCFPDIENTLDAAIADDENTIRCQVVIRGTQAKDFAGIVCNGKHFESDHIFIFKLDDQDVIQSIQVNWNHNDFQKQLA